MARGWESKSVEAQKEIAETKTERDARGPRTPEDTARQRELEGLELSRKKVLHDLETATHPRHRASLEAALKFLEEKIASAK
jgi:hypothetical protein